MLVKKTLATLARGGFKDSLWVVVPGGECADYVNAVQGNDVHCIVRTAPKGLTNQRRAFREWMLPRTEMVFIDDDIEAIKVRSPTGLSHVRNVHRLADYVFQMMKWKGDDCLLAGVYPVANRLWMSDRVSESNAYIPGCLYFLLNDERTPEPMGDEMEDYARQLYLQAQKLPTLRINWIGVQTQYFKNPGGLQTLRTEEGRKSAITELVFRHPTLVIRKLKRGCLAMMDLAFLQKPTYWTTWNAALPVSNAPHTLEEAPVLLCEPPPPSVSAPPQTHHTHPTPPDPLVPDAS